MRELSAKKFNIGEYYINIACAIKPLNFILIADDKKKKSAEGLNDSMLLPGFICAGCIIASAAIFGVLTMGNISLTTTNKGLESSISSKINVIDEYNSYLTSKVINDGIHMIESSSNVPNDAFLDLIAELEENMPSDLLVSALSVSGDVISITATCDSKNSAAETLIKLRTFSSVYNVECSGITEEENDAGKKRVNISFTLTYTGMQNDEEEGGDDLLTETGTDSAEPAESTQ